MVMIEFEGGKYRLNKTEKLNLDIGLEAMTTSVQDMVIVIDGSEGSGKSKKARQIGHYCASYLGSKFDRDGIGNIHNEIDKYVDSCLSGGVFAVNILDEGRKALNRKRSMAKATVKFTNFMSECRELRQVHIILLPAYHDLDSYIALWRMNILFHLIKHFKADEKSKSGYSLELGHFKLFANDEYTKFFYNIKYKYPKKWICQDRFSNVEILTDKGLKVYTDQKIGLLSVKYGSNPEKKVKLGMYSRVDKMPKLWLWFEKKKIDFKERAEALGISLRQVYVYNEKYASTIFE